MLRLICYDMQSVAGVVCGVFVAHAVVWCSRCYSPRAHACVCARRLVMPLCVLRCIVHDCDDGVVECVFRVCVYDVVMLHHAFGGCDVCSCCAYAMF